MESNGYARPDLLAEPDWLTEVQSDPAVCLVDCSGGTMPHRTCIPGAVALPVHFSLKDAADPLHVIGPQDFAALMGQMGIGADTTVVAYDRYGGMAAARLWWVLTYYGHPQVRLLNGGWLRWREEKRPAAQHLSEREPVRFVAHRNAAMLAELDYVRTHLEDDDVRILDARNASEWSGPSPWGNRRSGHLPGAVRWEWVNSLSADPGRAFRLADELHAELAALGLSPRQEVITHCQAGIRASHAAFVLTLLGYERVRNYEASMKEWANLDDTPLQDGDGAS